MNEQLRRQFYELCQQYRHAPAAPQALVCDAYEALIAFVDALKPDRSSEAGIRARSEAFRERRELNARAALQGLLANPSLGNGDVHDYSGRAVAMADALMARLDATATQEGK